jgi:hypothetical protein
LCNNFIQKKKKKKLKKKKNFFFFFFFLEGFPLSFCDVKKALSNFVGLKYFFSVTQFKNLFFIVSNNKKKGDTV